MKVAICYSGMFREFLDCIENHKSMLIDKYDCDVYLDLWDVYGYGKVSKKYSSNEDVKISSEDITKVNEVLNPVYFNLEPFRDVENELIKIADSISTHDFQPHPKNVLGMYYKIKKVGKQVVDTNTHYDVVVRIRTDMIFNHQIDLNHPIEKNTFYVNHNGGWDEQTIGDWFGYGDYETMNTYSKMYDRLILDWCGVGPTNAPEFLIYTYLQKNGIKINKRIISLQLKREIK